MATRKSSGPGRRKSDGGRRKHGGNQPGRGGFRRTPASQTAEAPKLPKTARRVHDAVELASGRIETTSTARAPSAATRLRQLARFGFRIDLSLFGPSYRLTAQTPYQATPEAWLDAFDGSYSAGPLVNRIWWRLPATFPTTFIAGVNLNFRGLRAGPAVFSLKFEAWPYQGRTGTVVIMIGAQVTEIPISARLSAPSMSASSTMAATTWTQGSCSAKGCSTSFFARRRSALDRSLSSIRTLPSRRPSRRYKRTGLT